MIESVKKYMKVPVKVYTFLQYDGSGKKIVSSTPVEYKCLPNYSDRRVVNTKGEEIISNIQLFLPRTAVIGNLDIIEFAGLRYDIKSLNGFYGSHTVGLWMVML